MSGTFFIVSAPSGAGKTSIIDAVLAQLPGLSLSTSYTTRKPRQGEVDGESYHFVSEQQFMQLEREEFFLESAQVFSARYGTAKSTIEKFLQAGTDIVLELDWQGALQVKAQIPEAQWIFILPPSLDALAARLQRRQQDSEQVIAERMAKAQNEMRHYHESDFLIINDQFEQACADLINVIKAQRLKTAKQQKKCNELLEKLI